ncbi:hypothetical protein RI129_001177 [Pyrocoelia pectoralis]|uniref:Uncharacterized protein n=1 Tax=Pyrocoelia pectoralis TaxID=417401 RepID=A0AAN7VUT7_9COLE
MILETLQPHLRPYRPRKKSHSQYSQKQADHSEAFVCRSFIKLPFPMAHPLYELYNEPNIIQVIKGRRLRWLGHMERLPDDRIVKKLRWSVPEGQRKGGIPRREAVNEDLKEKERHNCKEIAKDRVKWKLFTRQWA